MVAPGSVAVCLRAFLDRMASRASIRAAVVREAFTLPGTPIRLTLRAKANPYAGRKRR